MAVALVALGGAVGCLGRTGLEVVLGEWHSLSLGQALANVTGAFALGLLTARLAGSTSPWAGRVTLLLGTGVLGGWTTYSGLALQTVATAEASGVVVGAVVLAASVVAGVGAAALGVRVGRRRHGPGGSR